MLSKCIKKLREISSSFYYIAFILYFLFIWVERINFNADFTIVLIKNFLRLSVVTLLLLRYLFLDMNMKGFLFTAALAGMGFATWRISGEGWLFWLILFLITAKEVKLRKLALISLIQSVTILTIVPLLTLFGAAENIQIQKGSVTRDTLGFLHPNYIGILVLIICISVSVTYLQEKLLLSITIIGALTVFNMYVAYSRSAALLSLIQIILLLLFFFVNSQRMRSILSYCMLGIVSICILLSYSAMVFYRGNNLVWATLNKILSGRLRLANGYFEMYPLTLFGRDYAGSKVIAWNFDGTPRDFVVDNAYAHLLLRYGIIPTVIFLAAYLFVMYKLAATNAWNGVLFGLVLFAIYGLTETHGIRIDTNFLLYYLGSYLLFENKYFTKEQSRSSGKILDNRAV